jgi:heat shock protein HslJ
MKKVLILIPIAAFLVSCGTPKPNRTGSGSNAMQTNKNTGSEEVKVVGTEYISVEGKNEFGIRGGLKGNWILESAPGGSLANNKAGIPPIETKNDTVTRTETVNGVTTTSSTVQMTKPQDARITPAQSSNPNMHVPEKPSLRFFGSNETFSGFTGCNKLSGRYTQMGNNGLSFSKANPSTKMVCIGDYDEEAFVGMLRRVSSFKSTGGKLQLMEGDNVLLVFSKK